ncbi:MAG TPA: BamA/TamA family outer membrane protein [Chthonomonadales bacterium]|nr:BamA/TamA family outer membrane protein [Chthonomonadales bacterium]
MVNTIFGLGERRATAPWRALPQMALALAVVVVAGLSVPALAQDVAPPAGAAAPQGPPAPRIIEINVVGNRNLNRESIVAASGLNVGDPITQASLDEAKRRLLMTQNFGARDPEDPDGGVRITADVGPEGARVRIEVDENDMVRGINITGTGPIPVAEIRALLQTREGMVLNSGWVIADLERIREYYRTRGYQPYFGEATVDENGILTIPVGVARVNRLRVTGLRKTREHVVLREMRQRSGEYYNSTVFGEDVQRLFNTGLFEDIAPAIAVPELGRVDLTLSITEHRTGTFVIGVGYSSRQQLVGHAQLGENNFMGRGQQVNVMWETGGVANRHSVEVGFTEPWLDRRNTSLSVNLYDKTVYRFGRAIGSVGGGAGLGGASDYFETHTGGSLTLSRPFRRNYRAFVGMRYDNVRVPLLDLSAEDAAILQSGPMAVLNFRVTHNTRDLDMEPAAGGFEMVSADIGRADLRPVARVNGNPVGVVGSVVYQKLQADLRRYFSPQGPRRTPRDRRTTIAVRLALGFSNGTLPFSEQYFVGGAETLRGYHEDRFWGSNMLLGSAEFRTPLANALTGVAFVDVGDAWGGRYVDVAIQGFRQHRSFSPNMGLGFGLRVVTPIGPIRIDQGFGSEGARTHFSIGHVF